MEGSTGGARFIRFGVFEADLRAGELRKQGLRIKLQEKPFQLLAMLLERPGDVMTREELRKKLWPEDTFVDFDHSINIAINKLREALGDSAENPRFVETLAKRGYRFIAPVDGPVRPAEAAQRVGQPDPQTVGPPLQMNQPSQVMTGGSTGQAISAVLDAAMEVRRSRTRWRNLFLGLAIAALLVVVYLKWKQGKPPEGKIMLVVLPFENLSGDPEQEYFSDGLTDETIAQLGRLDPERLGVIARTSAMKYKHADKDIRQIERELGVQYVLEGTVRRAGERVRITAQLIQVSDQTHLFAESYEHDLRDILGVQNDVARAVAGEIKIKLTPQIQARLANTRSVNPEAYEDYLKGRFYWNKRTADGLLRSIDFFQRAIQKDPNFALAYTGLADAYGLLGTSPYDALPPQEGMSRAERAAVRAVELDNNSAEAHASLAYVRTVYDWNFPDAEREFQRAFELNAGYATAHQWYAWYLTAAGRLDEAAAENERARKLDPLSLVINAQIVWSLYVSRRYDQAIAQSRAMLELDRNFFMTHYNLGQAYVQKKMYEEAITEFEKGQNLSANSPIMLMALGHAYALSGNRDKALKAIAKLESLSKKRYVPALYLAAIYTGLRDENRAFEWFGKAVQDRSDYCIQLNAEPMADSLRTDPRYKQLVQRIGLRL